MPLAPCPATLDVVSSPPCCGSRKVGVVELALLWTLLGEAPERTSRALLDKVAQTQAPWSLSVR